MVIEPESEAEVSDCLRMASRDGLAVRVRGGGTKLDWTPPPSRCDVELSTRRLARIVEHEPGDLVCVVEAGVRLDAVQAALGPHRQRLMLDPGHGVAATIGGIVAANAHGPLRTRYGGARDLVIGARFVLSDGTVGHSGGKVVKNVAGYDVAKLLVGSQGTLAAITEVALRVHPLPETVRTVAIQSRDAATLVEAWRGIEVAGLQVSSAALVWPDGVLLVRVEGSEAAIAVQLRRIPGAEARVDAVWDEVRTAVWDGATRAPVVVLGVPRTEVAPLLEQLHSVAERAVALPSLGLVEARLRDGVRAGDVVALRTWVEARHGHLTVRRPPAELLPVAWPQGDGVAVELMRDVKRSLDPTSTLAPGVFLGGL